MKVWKFWKWPKELRELRTLEEFHDALTETTETLHEMRGVKQERDLLAEKLDKLYERTPAIVSEAQQRRANLERLMVLAGLGSSPLWQTVLSYADEHARNEQQLALGPNLNDADRQYNAGRAGGALDFAMALRELRGKAEAEAAKAKA